MITPDNSFKDLPMPDSRLSFGGQYLGIKTGGESSRIWIRRFAEAPTSPWKNGFKQ